MGHPFSAVSSLISTRKHKSIPGRGLCLCSTVHRVYILLYRRRLHPHDCSGFSRKFPIILLFVILFYLFFSPRFLPQFLPPCLFPPPLQCYVVAYFVENQRNSPILGGGKEEDKESWSSANPSEGFSSKELDPVEAHRHEFDITVKYIRREIRDLTDRDRETFFNAMSIMQRVPSAVGRQIYGDKYYSKDYFNRLHLYYGEWLGACVRGWVGGWACVLEGRGGGAQGVAICRPRLA